MTAYYNEIEPFAAQWIRNLITAGHIAPGEVDERSIEDVTPSDLRGFTQCHFFAGVAVWSYALRRAGVSDDEPLWTGSCPCQPFSAAGKGEGVNDERHLWPAFFRLISACKPGVIFGEQVASNLVTGRGTSADLQRLWKRKALLRILSDWLEEDVSIHMQNMPQQDRAHLAPDAQGGDVDPRISVGGGGKITGRTEGTAVRSYCPVGPGSTGPWSLSGYWNRFRLDREPWVGQPITRPDNARGRLHNREHEGDSVRLERGVWELGGEPSNSNGASSYGEAAREIRRATEETNRGIEAAGGGAWIDTLQADLEAVGYAVGVVPFPASGVGAPFIGDRLYWVGTSHRTGLEGLGGDGHVRGEPGRDASDTVGPVAPAGGDCLAGPTNGFWRDCDWLLCADGKRRPVRPGTFPLVDGAPARVGRLRAFGNAINAAQAEIFIRCVMECRP